MSASVGNLFLLIGAAMLGYGLYQVSPNLLWIVFGAGILIAGFASAKDIDAHGKRRPPTTRPPPNQGAG